MATNSVSSSTTTSAQAAEAKLKELQRQSDLLLQRADQKAKVSKVQEFQKNTRDIVYDNSATARDIGKLKKDESRLNLFSALSKNDKADVYRFSVDQDAETRLGVLVENNADKDSVRIQILRRGSNQVIADSGVKEGDQSAKNFEDLVSGKLELKKGDYILRISRKDGIDSKLQKTFNYAVQLTQGLYTKDYDTIEKAAAAGDNPYGLTDTSSTSNLRNGLSQAVSFLTSLPKIGTSASEKLNGALFNSLF